MSSKNKFYYGDFVEINGCDEDDTEAMAFVGYTGRVLRSNTYSSNEKEHEVCVKVPGGYWDGYCLHPKYLNRLDNEETKLWFEEEEPEFMSEWVDYDD